MFSAGIATSDFFLIFVGGFISAFMAIQRFFEFIQMLQKHFVCIGEITGEHSEGID